MKATDVEIKSMIGIKKIQIKFKTEKRGSIESEFSIPEIMQIISDLAKCCEVVHAAEMQYLDIVCKENKMYKDAF